MSQTYIVNGQVYIDRRFQPMTVGVEGEAVRLLPPDAPLPEGAETVDAAGMKVVPGFIDVHTHGGVGVHVNGADAEDLEKLCRFFAGNGTTAWLCSVLTDTVEQTNWCIDQFKFHKRMGQPTSELLGIHLEGPFLASEYKGAMPEHLLRAGDAGLPDGRYHLGGNLVVEDGDAKLADTGVRAESIRSAPCSAGAGG